MSEFEEKKNALKTSVETALNYLKNGFESSFHIYLSESVIPNLETLLESLRIKIEKRHSLGKPDDDTRVPVVHYTSVANIVSILQMTSKREGPWGNSKNELPDERSDSGWRLYDSVHFNDPDEGNYLIRHLGQNKRYRWLEESSVTPAYIASFILPETDADVVSDNLVFWRTYGREGEGCALKINVPRARLWRVLYKPTEEKKTEQVLSPVLNILYPLTIIKKDSIRVQVRKKLGRSL